MIFYCDGEALKVVRKYRCHPVYGSAILRHTDPVVLVCTKLNVKNTIVARKLSFHF
jgi:hypothetical protein